jgi:hypothetical protein
VRFVVDQHTGCNAGYTIPGGKALIITTITSFLHNAGVGDDTEGLLMTGTSGNCSTYVAAATSDTASTETVVQNIEPGLAVPAGLTVNGLGSNNNGSSHVYGYLVPASAVPAAAKAAAARISASSPTQADGS